MEDLHAVSKLTSELAETHVWESEIDSKLSDPRLKAIASLAVRSEQDKIQTELVELTSSLPIIEIAMLHRGYMSKLADVRLEIQQIEQASDDFGFVPDEGYLEGLFIEEESMQEQVERFAPLLEFTETSVEISPDLDQVDPSISSGLIQSAPESQVTNENGHELSRRINSRGGKPVAYIRIADHLQSQQGRIISIEELARVIYPDSTHELKKIKSRVHATIGYSRDAIEENLASRGLRLIKETILPGRPGNRTNRTIVGFKAVATSADEEIAEDKKIASIKKPEAEITSAIPTEMKRTGESDWQPKFRNRVRQILNEFEPAGLLEPGAKQKIGIDHKLRKTMRKLGDIGVLSQDQAESLSPDLYTSIVIKINKTDGNRFTSGEVVCDQALSIIQSEIARAIEEH